MGITGRWIDSLSDDSRDRIIEHPDPSYDGEQWWSFQHDCGCLVGCAVGQSGSWRVVEFVFGELLAPTEVLREGQHAFIPYAGARLVTQVGRRFPELTERFTPERVWRLVKARAARGNQVVMPAVTEEAAAAV